MTEEKNGKDNNKPASRELNPEFDNFQHLLKDVLAAPEEKMDEKRAKYGHKRKEKN